MGTYRTFEGVGAGLRAIALEAPPGFVGVAFTPGSNVLLAYYSAGTTDPPTLYTAPAGTESASAVWRKVVSPEDLVSPGADNSVAVHGSTMYLLADKGAPNRKLVALDLEHPDMALATVLVPSSDAVLTGVYAAEDALYLSSKQGVSNQIRHSAYGQNSKGGHGSSPVQRGALQY